MHDGSLAEGEGCKSAGDITQDNSALRAGSDLFVMLCIVYASHTLASMVVGSGMRRDILAAGCQLVVGLGVVLAVHRPASVRNAAIGVLEVLGITAIYWVVVRSGVDLERLPMIICCAIGWFTWEGLQLTHYRELLAAMDATERVRRAYRIFMLSVCAVVMVCLEVLYPDPRHSPTDMYPLLPATVAAALICYMHFRLALLETTTPEISSGPSGEQQ